MITCLQFPCVLVHSGDVACFTVADGGAFVLTGDSNGGLQTWCAVDGGVICTRPGAHSGAVACLAFLDPILVRVMFLPMTPMVSCSELKINPSIVFSNISSNPYLLALLCKRNPIAGLLGTAIMNLLCEAENEDAMLLTADCDLPGCEWWSRRASNDLDSAGRKD